MHRALIRPALRALVPALVLSLGLGLASCKTAPAVKAPGTFTVEPTGLSTTSQTLSSFTVTLSASVENPGTAPLAIDGADYKLTVGGKVLRTGHAPLEVTVAPGGHGPALLPGGGGVRPQARRAEEAGEHRRPSISSSSGTVDGTLGKQAVKAPFSRAGALRSPRLPVVKLGTPDAARQSLSEIAATFRLQVENDNPFPVKLDGLDYVLTVQGADVASGTVGDRTTVPALVDPDLGGPHGPDGEDGPGDDQGDEGEQRPRRSPQGRAAPGAGGRAGGPHLADHLHRAAVAAVAPRGRRPVGEVGEGGGLISARLSTNNQKSI